ncbi:hypothetical protein BASA61_007232 [Batrachochytrium salamandrivorans]|nr:hypothetical protein BASA60_005041 [Batrachochytrium salamandrivorans]KAH6577739.1 hypothetical protein BASA62_000720 [Batrachochytrium salamandrivorans]KAH6584864.1 hypothetical protein BASA61_007232 [Batrachochytrium salamandrivorans]KAH9273796.1 hypothetical protein BASA83_003790 [Batrachochytrium salamandrivorans]
MSKWPSSSTTGGGTYARLDNETSSNPHASTILPAAVQSTSSANAYSNAQSPFADPTPPYIVGGSSSSTGSYAINMPLPSTATTTTSAGPSAQGKMAGMGPAVGSSATGLSGSIGSSAGSDGARAIGNTLDEPVSVTIMRDLNNIGAKVRQVLLPASQGDRNILRDWDWWGPLLLCLVLSVRLSLTARSEQGPAVFSATFFIIWFGSAVVTVNSKLLGGKISFFQSVCVLGYCVFPLVAVSIFTWILPFFLKFILVIAAFGWSTFASLNFMGNVNLENKRTLAVYPIFLFYLTIAWLILIAT